jgi:hypothetical protein
MKNGATLFWVNLLKSSLKDALFGLTVAALLIAIILFSSGTTKFVYIDF